MNRLIRRHLLAALDVCARLEDAGCRILAAHAHQAPAVRISPPPAGLIPTYGYREPPRSPAPVPVTCVAIVDGVRVEWIETTAGAGKTWRTRP